MGEQNKPRYYRYQRTGNMIPRTRKRGGKDQDYLESEVTKIFFDEEYVKNFSLDRFGLPIHSKIANYTTVENYLLDFWSPVIGGEAVFTFILLIRHCYGYDADGNKKDFSFPELETLAEKWGKTVPTVKKYLDILEDHYFIYRFWRSDPDHYHTDDSILYKLRTSVPYLSEEHLLKLSPKLQSQHDRFLKQLMGKYNETIELPEKYDFSAEFSRILEEGSPAPRRRMLPEELEEYHRIREAQLLSKIKPSDKEIWEMFLEIIGRRVAFHSIQTWLVPSFCILDDAGIHIYAPNPFVADWIRSRYVTLLEDAFQQMLADDMKSIYIHSVRDRENVPLPGVK
ncbi:DnaA N-terminal domain-containing protein [Paenibacillus sp. GYB004]|uniref:DnaA N-terminal domain-containing protein n=1 Tax=Paenibacillus sp. GYB004 TaxID=2994393 RepID=UPI002F966610